MRSELEPGREFSAGNIPSLARLVSVLELYRARRLACSLPETATFEEHFALALAIGAAGRRIQLLIPAFLEQSRIAFEIAPITTLPVESEDSVSSHLTYGAFYQNLRECLSSFGYCTYDLCIRLDACTALDSAVDDNERVPLCIASQPTLVGLIQELTSTLAIVSGECRRSRRGPSQHQNDPRWVLLAADDVLPRMPRVEGKDGLLQKLHNTALRETVASEVAALNLLEYDGLPWLFYLDMARQCEDEARHAILTATALRKRGKEIGEYPVSYLGNYYEMFWEMTLDERLVAMNLDIEAVGQGYLAGVARRLKAIDEEASQLYDFISVDENRHARIGIRWLEYLYPDSKQRKQVIEACRGLLLVNLASAHTAAIGGTISDTLHKWTTSGLFRFAETRTVKHEEEITPLLARRSRSRLSSASAQPR
jgi:uncharacterized ferritin-like protein (DUF455 family)